MKLEEKHSPVPLHPPRSNITLSHPDLNSKPCYESHRLTATARIWLKIARPTTVRFAKQKKKQKKNCPLN
jgi:hypothetical protein